MHIIKKKTVKAIAGVLIAALMLTSCGKKAGETTEQTTAADTEAVTEAEEEAVDIDRSKAVFAGSREESVSIKAAADGTIKEIKSEILLSDLPEGKPVKDTARLSDILNKEGDEEYVADGDFVYWENKGVDISYTGKSEEKLPFDVKVTYYLDDEKTAPEEMAGKSGKVKIRFDYKNNTRENVKVDGEAYKVNVPFAFISAVTLDDEKFKNIQVENGKVTKMSGQTMAIGYAFPGLKESLKLDTFDKDINVSDFVEITADATEFALDFTVTMVVSGLLEDIDVASINDARELSDNMKDLGDASDELADAANKLANGANTFGGALNQYISGMNQLNNGATSLRDGLGQINGNTAALVDGANKLSSGLTALDQAIQKVDTSGGGISETDMANLQAAFTGLAQDAGTMGQSIGALQQNLAVLSEQVNAVSGQYPDIDTSAAMANINTLSGSLASMGNNVSTLQSSLQNISTAMEGMKDMTSGLEQLKPTISALASGSNELATGIAAYGQGVSAAYDGAAKLVQGTNQLAGAGGQLSSGYSTLAGGLREYANGMRTFDEEGIQELSELAGDDLGVVIKQLKAVKLADDNYTTFSGGRDVKQSTVRFVIETEGIEE